MQFIFTLVLVEYIQRSKTLLLSTYCVTYDLVTHDTKERKLSSVQKDLVREILHQGGSNKYIVLSEIVFIRKAA